MLMFAYQYPMIILGLERRNASRKGIKRKSESKSNFKTQTNNKFFLEINKIKYKRVNFLHLMKPPRSNSTVS